MEAPANAPAAPPAMVPTIGKTGEPKMAPTMQPTSAMTIAPLLPPKRRAPYPANAVSRTSPMTHSRNIINKAQGPKWMKSVNNQAVMMASRMTQLPNSPSTFRANPSNMATKNMVQPNRASAVPNLLLLSNCLYQLVVMHWNTRSCHDDI